MSDTRRVPVPCTAVQLDLAARLDGESGDLPEPVVRAHVERCATCREHELDLQALRGALRDLPQLALPETVTQRLWRDTIDAAPPRSSRSSRPRPSWLAAAAALGLAVTASLIAWWVLDARARHREAELARVDRDLQRVLALVGHTLGTAERLAVDKALINETAPALEILPLERH